MGIRETINKKRGWSIAAAAAILAIAGVILARTFWPEPKPQLDRAYYTDDDGQSYFEDSMYLVPPFDHGGKTAVRAMVYRRGYSGYVAYEQRFKADIKKKLDDAVAEAAKQGKPPSSVALFNSAEVGLYGTEVKQANSSSPWVTRLSDAGNKVMDVRNSDGSLVEMLVP